MFEFPLLVLLFACSAQALLHPLKDRVVSFRGGGGWQPAAPITASEWAHAQRLVGLEEAVDPQRLDAWNARYRGQGTWGDVEYIMEDKCGSEAIAGNLEKWADSGGKAKRPCKFSFVRHPIERFASAYTETEFRFKAAQKKNLTIDDSRFTFHRAPLGSTERAEAFVKDLLSMYWTTDGSQYTEGAPVALFYAVGLLHVFPMTPQLIAHSSDRAFSIVGKLEQFDEDWKRLNEYCGTNIPFNRSIGVHKTSKDPMHVKESMELLLARSEVRDALCQIYRQDLASFGYSCTSTEKQLLQGKTVELWWEDDDFKEEGERSVDSVA